MTPSNPSTPNRRRPGLRGQIALLAGLALVTAAVAYAARPADSGPGAGTPPVGPPAPTAERPRIEVAFVLDTTGSMSGLIEGAKRKIWSIANQLAAGQPAPEIRVGVVGYRDRGDAYVTRLFDLTDDLDAVYGRLRAFRAEGGGDTPESVNRALHEAVTRLAWTPGSRVYKVVFLVGDAPPHMDYPNDVAYPETVALARSRHILVNTVQAGRHAATASVWRRIARLGGGQYASIAQDGAMLALTTPYDERLAELNRELADTAVPYGDAAQQQEIRSKVARSVAAEPEVAASRLGFLAKLGGSVNSGRRDLVDAVEAGEVDPAALPAEALPAALRALDADERESFVEKQRAKRQAAQTKIRKLSAERDAYVRNERERRRAEGDDDGFDRRVLDTLRTQAEAAGIRYE